MVMRIGGLASGMDIDALVEKLMNAERAPLNKLSQKKTTYEWQRDAYRNVNTKLKTFDTYIADNLVLKTINSKTATSSNSNLVTATATGTATGTLSIEGVSQLATSTKVVGKQVPVTSTTKLSDLFDGDMPSEFKLASIDATGKMGKDASITIDENTTVGQFISKINSSSTGVNAVFENGKLSITTKNSGRVATGEFAIKMSEEAADIFEKLGINLQESGPNATQIIQGKNARFIVNGIATERTSNSFTINGYNVILNTTFNESITHGDFVTGVGSVLSAAELQLGQTFDNLALKYYDELDMMLSENEKYEALSSELSAYIDSYTIDVNDANEQLKASQSQSLATANAQAFLNTLTEDQKSKFQAKALSENAVNALNLSEDQLEQYNNLSDEDKESLTKTAGKTYTALSTDVKNALANIQSLADVENADLTDEQKESLLNLTEEEFNAIKTVANSTAAVKDANAALTEVKKDLATLNQDFTALQTAKATVANANDLPSQNNEVPAVTLSASTNVDEMMTKIKDFVTTYNALIKDFNDQLTQSKYRDYAPLTAEQKKEMVEDEIKLWEEKAKSGLLRNDSLIRDGLSNMRSLIYQSNPAISDSRYNTLFSIGITTSKNYNDGGTLEIDEAKLRKAIGENPEAIEQLFKNSNGKKEDTITYEENGEVVTKTVDTRGYLIKLRESMKSFELNIEKKAGRSTMTERQYSLGKSIIDTESRISTWDNKLKSIEERYWKQFTAMETAINKANQQSSIFAQG